MILIYVTARDAIRLQDFFRLTSLCAYAREEHLDRDGEARYARGRGRVARELTRYGDDRDLDVGPALLL
jgi:hypothetical protein